VIACARPEDLRVPGVETWGGVVRIIF
jgi:hypothetical protein